jgi:hypothetical protein
MKLLARDDRSRPTEAVDVRELAAVASGCDWDLAKDAVRLVTERGFNRGRDLYAALAEISP